MDANSLGSQAWSLPLFLESGMADLPAPQYAPWAQLMDPNERAAERLRAPYADRVQPQQGPPPMATPGEMAQAATMAIPAGGVLGLIGRAATMAPRAFAGGLAGAGLMASTGQAGEDQFQWVDPDKDRTARINSFEVTMNNLNREMRAASRARMPSVQAQMEQLTKQHNTLLAERQKERDAEFVRWQQQQAAKTEAERPFREQYPTAYRMLPLAGWATSALGGVLGSRGGAPVRSMIGGALGGIPGSAAAAVGPTAYDAATLPTGSKHQAQAAQWLSDPNYWLSRVGPEVLVGSGLGATAAKYGSYIPRPGQRGAGAPSATPSSAIPPATPPVFPGSASTAAQREAELVREYEKMTSQGYVLNEPQSRMYGYLVWMKP